MNLFYRAMNFARRESTNLSLSLAAFLTRVILSCFRRKRPFAYSWKDICEPRLVTSSRMRLFAHALPKRNSTTVFALNEFERVKGKTIVCLGKEDRLGSIMLECLDFMDISVRKADDAESFLSGYNGKIDLLYISGDIHSKGMESIITKGLLSENCTILINNPTQDTISYLIKNGFNPVLSDKQCVFVRDRGSIPKIIHQIWVEGDIPPKLKILSESWKKLNPDWHYKLWTGKEMEDWVRQNRPDIIDAYVNYTGLTMNKANMFRYLALHSIGGVYADMDTECIKPLNFLFHKNVKYNELVITYTSFYPVKRKDTILNAFIASIPKHPLWPDLIKEMCERLSENKYPVLRATGTSLFEEFVEKYPYKVDSIYRRIMYPLDDIYNDRVSAPEKFKTLIMLITRKYYPESCVVHYWHHSCENTKSLIDLLPGGKK